MYTFLTVLHVIVCIFLMLVVLLQAGRGGGIGLAFGGSGGSQSVFGSSGGATFLTKMTAVCAILFMANSLALAYLSSQSDSRRLEKIAEKKALAKKAEEATNAKMLTDIEKQREAQAQAAAAKSEAVPAEKIPEETTAEESAPSGAEKAATAGKTAGAMAAPALKLTLPGQGAGTAAPGASKKLGTAVKVGKPALPPKAATQDQPAADDTPAEEAKPTAERIPAAARRPAAEKQSDETEKPAAQ